MLGIQSEVAVSPRAVSGKDVIPLIPRLRFPSHRKEQLQTKNDQQDADPDDFTCMESHLEDSGFVCITSIDSRVRLGHSQYHLR